MNLDRWFQDNEDWRPYADLVVMPPIQEDLMGWYSDVSPEVLSRCCEMVQEGGGHVSRGALYVRIRREDKRSGNNKWATMLCLQAPPGIKTTDTFWSGRKSWVEVYGEEYANRTKKALAAKGVHLKAGDEYMPELARHPNDPEAVVPFGNARGYIQSLCEKRGWAAHGAVEVKHRQPDKDPHTDGAIPMAEDLIRQNAQKMIQKDPKLKKLKKPELRQAVLDRFGPSK